jgi:hypothetical protein
VKRAAGSLAGDAYQGAIEAVMAVLVGAAAGYWVDRRWGTTPYGVLVGVVVGFAAMVLRLLRMGREIPLGDVPERIGSAETGESMGSVGSKGRPEAGQTGRGAAGEGGSEVGSGVGEDRGPAEMPGLSDVWRDDAKDEQD